MLEGAPVPVPSVAKIQEENPSSINVILPCFQLLVTIGLVSPYRAVQADNCVLPDGTTNVGGST